jgi:HSP20 family protein
MSEFSRGWMRSEACDNEMLARAERLHRELFRRVPGRHIPTWEPPVDVLETEREVLVAVALPGVEPDQVETVIEGARLVVTGHRVLPAELATAVTHRLELPQGRVRAPHRASGRALRGGTPCRSSRLRAHHSAENRDVPRLNCT